METTAVQAHFFGNQLRHGKSAGQQNNQHGDPILSTGYIACSVLDPVITLASWFTHNNRIIITAGTGSPPRQWRGRVVERASISTGGFPAFDAYIFVVAPFKDSPGLDVEIEGGGGGSGPGDVTITVTNGNGGTAPATASPTQVPID